MGFSDSILKLGLFGLFLVYVPTLMQLAFRKQYAVPQSGAIFVTGASSGIGRHACLGLADLGPYTVYCSVRKEKDAQKLVEANNKVKPVLMDVTKDEDIVRAAETITSSGLPLALLVNNAGVVNVGALEFLKLSDVRWVFEVNYFGVLRLTQLLTPALRASKGRMVTVGSVAGILPSNAGGLTYAGTKHAIEALTDAFRKEMNPHGVAVGLLEPAMVKSDIIENYKEKKAKVQETTEQARLYPRVYGSAPAEKAELLMSKASPQNVTTDAIVDFLTNPYPKTRYVVANVMGIPAWVIRGIFYVIPDRLADALLDF